jgi:aldehyde dehydrogenase (NAD+)
MTPRPLNVSDILATMDYGPNPESADVAHAWLDRHQRRFGHFIGGAWHKGSAHFDSINPATMKPLAAIAQATPAVVDAAVAAAA